MSDAADLLAGLNPQQREAVLAADGPVLILAGAGSGKTRVITHRLAHLARDRGVPTEALLAVTFTNKAAGEMKERAAALLGGALRSWICTFHSLCVRLLRREWQAAGLAPGFVIYDEADQLSAVRAALREIDLSEKLYPPRRVLSAISAAKNQGRDPREPVSDGFGSEVMARIAGVYLDALGRAGALDFDDLLLHAARVLGSRDDVRARWRARFRYVLVDEYQDTNRVQYDLIRHLAGGHGNITVVGDEDQSIYSWRGADIRNILDFERDFPGARVLRLEQNYRSTQAILDAAGALVARNRERKGKTLRATLPGGDAVLAHEAEDEFAEAAWVVERIAAAPTGARCAVLYRTNAQSRLFEEALRRRGMAYVVVGGVGFYERREVKDVLSYLRLLLNAADDVALRRVVNVPPRGIGERTLDVVAEVAARARVSLWDAIAIVEDERSLPARATIALTRFRDLVAGLREELPGLGPAQLVLRVVEATGYEALLSESDSHESEERLANLAELAAAAGQYEEREEGVGSLAGFLDGISLVADVDVVRGEGPVVLMTLHSAKGLEFDEVSLAGMEQGLIPHARSAEDERALEEERRLCYVGMTRAKRRLRMSRARSRMAWGVRKLTEPSLFLEEIPGLRRSGSPARPPAPAWGSFSRGGAPRMPATAAASGPAAAGTWRPGVRVRHALFGVGTVIRSEGAGDEAKVTVSFPGVGAKRLLVRFAGLEEA